MTDERQPSDTRPGETPLFWVTRQGARIALIALHVAALIAVVTEFVFPFPEDAHAVERVHALDFPASYAIYGFVACVILVLLGIVLRRIVMRDENYYGEER
ncbi:MAG TPA: hypothetical protein VHG33_00045 [Woeseiaceae bacterium]|nr:hypothetical protein [Woeseiaceae bacterium]